MAWWSTLTDAELDAQAAEELRKFEEESDRRAAALPKEPARPRRNAAIWQRNPDGSLTKLTAD